MGTIRAVPARFRASQGDKTLEVFAAELGVHQGTASKVINKGAAPGPRFIAGALTAIPARFEDLFEVVNDELDPAG